MEDINYPPQKEPGSYYRDFQADYDPEGEKIAKGFLELSKRRKCPNCGECVCVCNGFAHNKQRYKCKTCGCNFTSSVWGFYSAEKKYSILKDYFTQLKIGKVAKKRQVSRQTISKWLHDLNKNILEIQAIKKERNLTKVDICRIDDFINDIKDYDFKMPLSGKDLAILNHRHSLVIKILLEHRRTT